MSVSEQKLTSCCICCSMATATVLDACRSMFHHCMHSLYINSNLVDTVTTEAMSTKLLFISYTYILSTLESVLESTEEVCKSTAAKLPALLAWLPKLKHSAKWLSYWPFIVVPSLFSLCYCPFVTVALVIVPSLLAHSTLVHYYATYWATVAGPQ